MDHLTNVVCVSLEYFKMYGEKKAKNLAINSNITIDVLEKARYSSFLLTTKYFSCLFTSNRLIA